jgi:hypothetical protein
MRAQKGELCPEAPCDLEEVFSEVGKTMDGLDHPVEIYGRMALICAGLDIADRLARNGVDEKLRVAIARLGKDREYERAVELFEALAPDVGQV